MSSREIVFAAAGASTTPLYVDDVFSTWTYLGAASDITLNTGINLADNGGLIWNKRRSAIENNFLQDTDRGLASYLYSNTTGAAVTGSAIPVKSVSTTGMVIDGANYTATGDKYVAWTFRQAPKFFDVVTYTGNGTSNQVINHNLGSVPGMMIVKSTSSASSGNAWFVYHRSTTDPVNNYLQLNATNAITTSTGFWNSTPSSTNFNTGAFLNDSGIVYVAYLFAHNAGGFGAVGADNIISCGSFTTDASSQFTPVNLGYEPQFVLIKRAVGGTDQWYIIDNIRGWPVGAVNSTLQPNTTNQESANASFLNLSSTGFGPPTASPTGLFSSSTYIYMAIRRPMKIPTAGTQVFFPVARTGTSANATISSGFVTDTVVEGARATPTTTSRFGAWNRLRWVNYLFTNQINAEAVSGTSFVQPNPWDVMNGYNVGTGARLINESGLTYVDWMFKRATNFHDVVCYAGDGSGLQFVTHNLGVIPELTIVKRRNSTGSWRVATLAGIGNQLVLNSNAGYADPLSNGIGVSSTNLEFYGGTDTNASNSTYVAYLFASVEGVSKIGSYTGTGATLTINCGFTGGARFVLIKRTNSTGDWWVFDTARGMVAGTNPRLALNLVNAESNANWVYTTTGGFQIVTTDASVNANGGAYIYLAVA